MAGGLAVWAAARVSGADRVRRTEVPVVQLMSATPLVAAAAPWAALALRLARRRKAALTAALAAGVLALVVQPRRIARPQPAAAGPKVRVLTFNAYFGLADAELIVDRVRRLDADVLLLQELTEDAVSRLKLAGLGDLLPYTQLELRGGSSGSGIYSRFRLREGPYVAPTMMAQPSALAELPGGRAVELICVHPCSPGLRRFGGTAQWRTELAVLPPPGELPRVLAGDFNATLDHAALRDVLRLGYADAGRQAGQALKPTWGLPGRNRAFLTLDHVLVDRSCAVLGYSVHDVPSSDHQAVYAEIQLPLPAAPAASGRGQFRWLEEGRVAGEVERVKRRPGRGVARGQRGQVPFLLDQLEYRRVVEGL
jgi:endonuclease/exonuclease/phosphatase (EEP) superfamily protein YafD